eukprot:scaffold1118_cov135-Cylindrotheca_fusiformis.AAC.8
MMRHPRDHDVWWYNFPGLHQGLVISSLALGALFGSHIVLVFLSDSIGRRKEIRIAASLYITGALLNIMAGSILAPSMVWNVGFGIGLMTLLCGRILTGVGVGFTMHGAPTYMAEMSPSSVRGTLVSAKETVIVFGIVVGMLMGDLMSDYPDYWVGTFTCCTWLRYANHSSCSLQHFSGLYYINIVAAIPMLLLTFKIPRSKRWLLMKGYREEAKESMSFVYKGDVEQEFERMDERITTLCCRQPTSTVVSDESVEGTSMRNDNGSVCETLQETEPHDTTTITDAESMFAPRYRHIIVLGVGLLMLQQFSGQPAVLAYSRVLFEVAGWNGHSSVVTVLIMGITSTLTVAFVDRLGRKLLLMTGSVIMTVSVLVLAYGFWGWDEDSTLTSFNKNLILVSMFVFISGYQVGFGPITWTVLSEVYPIEIRGKAMAFSVEVNFLCKFISQLFFPIIQDLVGWGSTFLLFCCSCAAGLVFVALKVPETKGMTLEEIEAHFGNPTKSNAGTKPLKALESPLLEDGEHHYVPRKLNPIA